jgi:hypothetical protein
MASIEQGSVVGMPGKVYGGDVRMKLRMMKLVAVAAALCATAWVAGCGSSSANVVSVTISPTAATVVASQVYSFTATVGGSTVLTVKWACTYSYTPAPTVAVPAPKAVTGTCPTDGSYGSSTVDSTTTVLTYTAPPLSKFPNPIPTLTYTATADANHSKTGTATISLDSGIRVSVSPGSATVPVGVTPAQTVQFTASLQNSTPTNLQFLVTQPNTSSATTANQTANPLSATCSPSCGSIDANGVFTAPSALPTDTTPSGSKSTSPTTVYLVVNSKSDPSQFSVATITLISTSTNPVTFTGISPTTVATGGVVQDIFLSAKNLLNTTTITFTPPGGSPQAIASTSIFNIPVSTEYCTPSTAGVTNPVTCDASIMTRIRLNQQQLATPGTATITVNNIPNPSNPGTTTSVSFPLQLVSVRPGLVAAVPDSFPQTTASSATTFSIDGGYYGGGSNPVVKLLFNGQLTTVSSFNPRQFTASLLNGQVPGPGLYPLSVQSNAQTAPPLFPTATGNVAVQPVFSDINAIYQPTTPPPAPVFPPKIALPAGGTPSSMALNSTKGYAVITEQASNAIQIVDLRSGTPVLGASLGVGVAPTGVAIDDQVSVPNLPGYDLGVVVNSGDNTLSLVGLANGAPLQKVGSVNLSGLFTQALGTTTTSQPFSVGVDPSTHLAAVAFTNTNIGFIADVNPNGSSRTCFVAGQTPPCVIASVSLNTGTTPQVVMEPNVPLAYVTPGGGGVLSVVNLLQTNTAVTIAAANASPAGAVRTNSVVTITTTTPHGINPAVGGTVLIAGVTPADLNGTYQVTPGSVTDPYTFQYAQTTPAGTTLANESGGGGTVTYGSPYYTFNVTNTVTGAAINQVTRTLGLVDPNATTAQVSFIRTLDQSVTSLTLTAGSCNGCTPTPAGAPESNFRSVSFDPYTNVMVAYAPSENTDPNLNGNKISLINPGGPGINGSTQTPYRIIQAIPTGQVGTGTLTPSGGTATQVFGPMVYDPKTKLVLVANAGSNTLTYMSVDPSNLFKPVEIKNVGVTSGGVPSAQPALGSPIPGGCNPAGYTGPVVANAVMLGCADTNGNPVPATLRVFGQGFGANSPSCNGTGGAVQVRLDQDATGITCTVPNDGEVDVTIAQSRLTLPHDFALDVVANGVNSNTADLFAVGVKNLAAACNPVPLINSSSLLQGQGPEGVAYDEIRNVAVVTNYSCSSISIINMDATNVHNYGVPYGGVLSTFAVGKQPLGVAVIPRLGYAVTANNGGNGTTGTASIINISNPLAPTSAATDVTVGIAPTGVGMDQDRALALVANSGSNTVSAIDLTVLLPGAVTTKTPVATAVAVGGPPNAIAVDPNRAVAVVTNLQNAGLTSSTGALDVISLASTPPVRSTSASINTLTANPTGIVYDPAVSPALFYATSTQENAVYTFNPDTSQTQLIRVGINPFSIAYNFQTGTMLTINSTSNTMSVVDIQTFSTRETLGLSSQSQFAAATDNVNNTAVVVDQNNNRVLLVPMPK